MGARLSGGGRLAVFDRARSAESRPIRTDGHEQTLARQRAGGPKERGPWAASSASASPRAADKCRVLRWAVGRTEKFQDFLVHGFGCLLSKFLANFIQIFS